MAKLIWKTNEQNYAKIAKPDLSGLKTLNDHLAKCLTPDEQLKDMICTLVLVFNALLAEKEH